MVVLYRYKETVEYPTEGSWDTVDFPMEDGSVDLVETPHGKAVSHQNMGDSCKNKEEMVNYMVEGEKDHMGDNLMAADRDVNMVAVDQNMVVVDWNMVAVDRNMAVVDRNMADREECHMVEFQKEVFLGDGGGNEQKQRCMKLSIV